MSCTLSHESFLPCQSVCHVFLLTAYYTGWDFHYNVRHRGRGVGIPSLFPILEKAFYLLTLNDILAKLGVDGFLAS